MASAQDKTAGIDPDLGYDPLGGDDQEISAWAPLKHTAFTVIWTAAVFSAIGTWMHDVAAGWLMTSLAPEPLMVAMVQAATTLPVFVLALPAGALADIIDRRFLLLVVMIWMAAVTFGLAGFVIEGNITPWHLIAFTLAAGVGAAFSGPAWQAVIPKLVPRLELQPAVSLISVGSNIARALGPALGGLLIGAFSVAVPFLVNAIAFCVVAGALLWWRPVPYTCQNLPPEQVGGAIRAGLRFAFASRPLRDTLVRAIAFFAFTSASWALLPLIAREVLGGGPGFYGVMQASIGIGAIVCAFYLPRLKKVFGPNRLVLGGTLASALAMLIFALAPFKAAGLVACLLAGAAWIMALSSLNTSAQLALPEWVRARGLSIFLMIFYGAMAAGSLAWGRIAGDLGIPVTLLIAAAGALVAAALSWRWKLYRGEALDMTPSMHWSLPVKPADVELDRGPVLVTIQHRVDPGDREVFLTLMHDQRAARKRSGAITWSIFEDVENPGLYIESFTDISWVEHLRHHNRVTESEKEHEKRVRALESEGYPVITHHVAPMRGASVVA